MKNREFRDDLKEMWLRKHGEAAPIEIVTSRDMIKLTAKLAAGCALAMGAAALAMMVVL